MKKTATLLVISFLFIFSGFSQKRNLTTDDGLQMVGLSSSMISPDGQSVIFGKSTLNWEKNKRETKYFYISADGENEYQYIGEDGASSLTYSPKGTYISLKRAVDKKQQVFLMRTSGGEAVQLTKHETSVGSYVWAEDESAIFFIADRAQSKEEEKKKKDGYDSYVVDEGPNGQTADNWNNVWMIDLKTKKEKQLTKGDHLLSSLAVAPNGKKLAFTRRTENRRNQGNLSEIYLYDLEKEEMIQLTDNAAPEGGLQWSPDSKKLAYTAQDDKTWELRNDKIWIMDPSTKDYEMASGNFEGNIQGYYWAKDGKSIYFNGLQRTQSNLYQLNLANKSVNKLTDSQGILRVYGMSKAQDKVLFSLNDTDKPSDLYVSDLPNFKPKQLTDLNPNFQDSFYLANTRVIQWKSKDGTEIEGLLHLPPDYEEGKKYPLLLHIHGGPAGVFTESFSTRYHVWAGLGYVQLTPNVRGSSGYTDELLRGNMKDIGGGDYEDLMTGVDKLIADGIVDEDKMAVRGWSYGGILGGTVITKTDRFKAASLGAMVSDWTSEYGIGFNFDVRLWYIGGTFWENPEGYRSKSALTNVEKVTTPTLLLHGMNDRTDTEAQSMMFFAALKDLGKDVRYIRFPREPHGFREPRHQRTRDVEEIKWVMKHTLGVDWEPKELLDKKKEEKVKP
jgi:dipeptidyl aminopeptidase/acylaminoacyl peptidase